MIISERKPIQEILESLGEAKKIFIVGCGGCAEVCLTGGQEQVGVLESELKEGGKSVTGDVVIDFLCSKALVGIRLLRRLEEIESADAVLVMSCGVGVQAVAEVVQRPVYPTLNSMPVGGHQGVWRSSERCATCGECVLQYTGGICPLTTCAKGLLSGACGGSDKGKCEVDPESDCGWYLIYERLKKLGRIDQLSRTVPVKDRSKAVPTPTIKKTIYWALEHEEEEEEPEEQEGKVVTK